MESSSLCLVDAMVLIDGVKYGFLEPLLAGHRTGVARAALLEVQYYKDESRAKHAIDLSSYTAAGTLTVCSATVDEVAELLPRLSRKAFGKGEIESLALSLGREHPFCTCDRRVVKEMKNLGIPERWVPLEELLSTSNPPRPVPEAKYSRAAAEPK